MEEHKNTAEVVSFSGRRTAIGSSWTQTASKGIKLSFEIRKIASTSGQHFAYTYKPGGDSSSLEVQYATFDNEMCEVPTIIGEAAIARNINSWVKGQTNSNNPRLFIKSLPRETAYSPSRFWVVPVEKNGRISIEDLKIARDSHELNSWWDAASLTNDQFTFVVVQNDGESKNFVDGIQSSLKEQYDEVDPIVVIAEDTFSKALDPDELTIKRVYRPSKIKVKKVAVFVSAAVIGVTSLMGLSYITQSDSRDFFENDDFRTHVSSKISDYGNYMKDYKGSSYWTDESYRKETIENFVDNMSNNMFKAVDIAVILREINRTLPIHAAEWRLTKLTYEKNGFYARYDRNQDGRGVYFMLDEIIAKINQNTANMSITPYDLPEQDQGEVRIFRIIPKANLERQDIIDDMTETIAKEEKLRSRYGKYIKRAYDKATGLDDLFKKYDNLTAQQKWVTRDSIALLEEGELLMSEFEEADSGLSSMVKTYNAREKATIDKSLILGNVIDFVAMMQMDSFFQWTYPKLVGTYPSEDMLEQKNKKKSKDEYKPAIESYQVTISTRESEEEGKIKSYGVRDMIQLGLLLDRPFINVDTVEYSKLDEQWVFSIHFNRQTPEYIRRIAAPNNTRK